MDPITGAALIGGGASILGGMSANKANSKEAKRNRAWQEAMSNSAHQREAKDLEKAGLNRILSLGKGAPMGGGSQAAPMQNVAKDASESVIKGSLANAQKNNIQADTDQKGATASLQDAQTEMVNWQKRLINEQIKQTQNTAQGVVLDNTLKSYDVQLANMLGTTMNSAKSGTGILSDVLKSVPKFKKGK